MSEFNEEYFLLEEFCSITGYPKSFVIEVSENSEDFWCFTIDGVLVFPKSEMVHNQNILNRINNWRLNQY